MEGVLNEGDKVKVKLLDIDPKTGKFRLSRKALMPKPDSIPSGGGGNDRSSRDPNRPRPQITPNK
jgi:polyribonucleotide nucleotidyltransferase